MLETCHIPCSCKVVFFFSYNKGKKKSDFDDFHLICQFRTVRYTIFVHPILFLLAYTYPVVYCTC